MNKLFYPRPLQSGDTVALTAPSSPVPAVNLKAAIKSVKLLGLNPVVMPSCREHHGYMAGTDAQRASDLNEAFSRKDIAGIFCLRGGFGAMRLLPLLRLLYDPPESQATHRLQRHHRSPYLYQ